MKKIVVNDIYDFSNKIYECARIGNTVYVVLFYDAATALMHTLLDKPDVSVGHIDFANNGSDYQKEYYVILDDSLSLSVQCAWDRNNLNAGYNRFSADVLFIDGEASYKIVQGIENKADCLVYELSIDDCELDNSTKHHENECDGSFNDTFCNLISHLILEIISEDDDDKQLSGQKDVLDYIDVINRRFAKDGKWDSENCYYFAVILKDRFPEGDIYYDVINGHFSYRINGVHYDHTGAFEPDGYLVKWDDFDEYDSIQKARIVRDCIL